MKYTPLVLILAVAMILIAGIVVDGDGKTQTVQQSLTIAEGAARAGTNAAAGNAINGDAFTLSQPAAINAANNYIAAAGATGETRIEADQVIVTVHLTYTPKVLSSFGFGPIPVQATASAKLVDHN
ncbi:hypothetical protein [Rathayibacter soli]|uniref:hypothetical protein n=1 Tax=Rathayibacter soli TaxID=3144168 RepID=UPI0027E42215|nr:hypothetical protein [Glaciibacter superstes]